MISYPKSAQLNRFLPKSKIFEFAQPSTKVKDLFTQQINKITIAYSLSSRSINLAATPAVEEIQILKLGLKSGELSNEVLKCIDMAIRSPLIFELHYNDKLKTLAAYKRPSEADPSKWVISEYFSSEWESEHNPRQPLPSALNLGGLYEQLLNALIPEAAETDEPIAARVERIQSIRLKQREVARVKSRLAREKQFNKRVVINAELRTLSNELKHLGATPEALN